MAGALLRNRNLILAVLLSGTFAFSSLILSRLAGLARQEAAPDHSALQEQAALEQLARGLRSESRGALRELVQFAESHRDGERGARAALALAHFEYEAAHYAEARRWLARAEHDALLREYVDYWSAQVERALAHYPEALRRLENFRRNFPSSVMTDAAVEALAEVALVTGKPARALAELDARGKAASEAPFQLLRARALEQLGRRAEAAAVYQAIHFGFPLSDETRVADLKRKTLAAVLGAAMPRPSLEQKLSRAAQFYDARRWRDARLEYAALLAETSGVEKQRAELRVAHCRVQLGAATSVLSSVSLSDPDLAAEQRFLLFHAFRQRKKEEPMLKAVEDAAALAPASKWTEELLFAAGNYFWINLDRTRAVAYYSRLLDEFPAGKNVQAAQWRVAWQAYLEHPESAVARIEAFLRRFPASPPAVNALYWLGRVAERGGQADRARGFYQKILERFPQTYFGQRSAERLSALGNGPVELAEVLSVLPKSQPLPSWDEPVPPAAMGHWRRGHALRSIAFDASAEMEFRAGHALSGSPRMLVEAARSAVDAGQYLEGIVTARKAYPQIEARRLEDIPDAVWRTLYPLAYAAPIVAHAGRAGLDPMLVAGLIRQESTFRPDAVSRAGALGLMQVLPSTGRLLARSQKLPYSRSRLFTPDYNLRLGTRHLADLFKTFGAWEDTLAAYNAGEHRVVAWRAERGFTEPGEFVESIPFAETRDYVQIVLRNAEIYRALYRSGKAADMIPATAEKKAQSF